MSAAKELLKEHKLRVTSIRSDVVNVFLKKDIALSQAEVEESLEVSDRVTVYRTLKSFLENGIIHKVLDDQGGAKYALCKEDCHGDRHSHEHIHFKCAECQTTSCLDGVKVPKINLPSGFVSFESNLLITGVCDKCSHL